MLDLNDPAVSDFVAEIDRHLGDAAIGAKAGIAVSGSEDYGYWLHDGHDRYFLDGDGAGVTRWTFDGEDIVAWTSWARGKRGRSFRRGQD